MQYIPTEITECNEAAHTTVSIFGVQRDRVTKVNDGAGWRKGFIREGASNSPLRSAEGAVPPP